MLIKYNIMDNHSSSYITEAPQHQQNALRAYVNRLQSKIDYAKWKQNLVLNYNYIPLGNIKQKIQNEYENYKRKMEAEEARLRMIVDNDEFITLLNNMGKFRNRLLEMSKEYEIKIENQREILRRLRNKCLQRREALKSIMRNKKIDFLIKMHENGISSARDMKSSQTRSKSTMSNLHSLTARSSRNSLGQFHRYHVSARNETNKLKQTYEDCLKVLNNQKNNKPIKKKLKEENGKIEQQNKQISWEVFNRMNVDEMVALAKKNNLEALRNLIY